MKDLPSCIDAEIWMLGSIFQHPNAMAQFAHALEPADFFLEKHQLVWEAFQSLQKEGRGIDIMTAKAEIEKTGKFQSAFVGKENYLFELSESVSSAANANHYAEMISNASALRRIIFASHKTANEAYKPNADSSAVAAACIESFSSIAAKPAKAADEHVADAAEQVLGDIRKRMEQGSPMGTQTGFRRLDEITGGFRPGEVVIVGARTGMGKTSFAIDVALHAARTVPVKFFSLEMAKKQIIPKALSFYSNVNLKRTINADLSEAEFLNHAAAVDELRKLRLYMEFEANLKIQEIYAEACAFTAKHGAGLIVIDHLHYLRTDGKNYENRNNELGKITHALKELAKKLDVPILLLSQLNRTVDRATAKDKKPKLSDLRDSGNIEQDADMVWFIHRDGYYDASVPVSETDIIVAKNRSGPTGEAKLYFDAKTTKFMEAKLE
jgi:replicative DNA helicase